MKQENEVEKLLSLIFQSRGQVMVKDGQLLVGPVEIARRFGDQIKRLKPEILIALGNCPVCVGSLTVEIKLIEPATENATTGRTGRHAYCGLFPWHYDDWKF